MKTAASILISLLSLLFFAVILPQMQLDLCALIPVCPSNQIISNIILIHLCYFFLYAAPIPPCTEFDFRARNLSSKTAQGFYQIIEANVEICINGTYVAICDLGWDDKEAQLACNALGFSEPFYRMFYS